MIELVAYTGKPALARTLTSVELSHRSCALHSLDLLISYWLTVYVATWRRFTSYRSVMNHSSKQLCLVVAPPACASTRAHQILEQQLQALGRMPCCRGGSPILYTPPDHNPRELWLVSCSNLMARSCIRSGVFRRIPQPYLVCRGCKPTVARA